MRRPGEGGGGPRGLGTDAVVGGGGRPEGEEGETLHGWTNGPRDGRNSSTRPRLRLRAEAPGRCRSEPLTTASFSPWLPVGCLSFVWRLGRAALFVSWLRQDSGFSESWKRGLLRDSQD